jgi:SAM-dependent methyltransferase
MTDAAGTQRAATRLCESLFEKWDPMFFETVDPIRVQRVNEILKALNARFRGPIRVLDLGSGPGTLSARVLDKLPTSHVVAVDTDPVLLRVGEVALRRFGKRYKWVLADLRETNWSSELPVHRFDAAISSLVLHWFEEDEISQVYREVRRLLRPEGLLLNGDFLPSSRSESRHDAGKKKGEARRMRVAQRAALRTFKSEWKRWWGALRREPTMAAVFRERRLRNLGPIPPRRISGPRIPVSLEAHERALRKAGFRKSTVTWLDQGFRVLIGVR